MSHTLIYDAALACVVLVGSFLGNYFGRRSKTAPTSTSIVPAAEAPSAAPTNVGNVQLVPAAAGVAPITPFASPIAATSTAAAAESTPRIFPANTFWDVSAKIDADLVSALHSAEEDGVVVEGTVQKYISSALTEIKAAL